MTMRYLYPGGPQTAMVNFDESGTQVRETDYGYGSEGETLSVTGSTEPVYYTYDPLYRLATLTDGSGHAASPTKSTAYFYNTAGYLAQIAYPGCVAAGSSTPTAQLTTGSANTVTFANYDAVGNLTKRFDGRNIETDYTYAVDNKPTDVMYPSYAANNVHYDYDGYGRKSGMADSVSGNNAPGSILDGVAYSYDDNDALTRVATTYDSSTGSALPTWTVSYAFNADGSPLGDDPQGHDRRHAIGHLQLRLRWRGPHDGPDQLQLREQFVDLRRQQLAIDPDARATASRPPTPTTLAATLRCWLRARRPVPQARFSLSSAVRAGRCRA